jgi:hypothetical protein
MSPETTIDPEVEIDPTAKDPVESVLVRTLSETKLFAVIVEALIFQKYVSSGVAFVELRSTLI